MLGKPFVLFINPRSGKITTVDCSENYPLRRYRDIKEISVTFWWRHYSVFDPEFDGKYHHKRTSASLWIYFKDGKSFHREFVPASDCAKWLQSSVKLLDMDVLWETGYQKGQTKMKIRDIRDDSWKDR